MILYQVFRQDQAFFEEGKAVIITNFGFLYGSKKIECTLAYACAKLRVIFDGHEQVMSVGELASLSGKRIFKDEKVGYKKFQLKIGFTCIDDLGSFQLKVNGVKTDNLPKPP